MSLSCEKLEILISAHIRDKRQANVDHVAHDVLSSLDVAQFFKNIEDTNQSEILIVFPRNITISSFE